MLEKIRNFYRIYGIYYIEIWLTHLVSVIGLLFMPLEYFFYGLFFFWLLLPLTQLLTHEYISHEYIQPRNRALSVVFLCLVYWLTKHTIFSKKNFHFYHHKHWQDPGTDPTLQKMKGSKLLPYLFSVVKPVPLDLPKTESSLLKNDRLIRWLDEHSGYIHYGSRLIMLILFPIEWFVVVNAYFVSMNLIRSNYSEYYFHGPLNGRDRNWMCLLFGNGVWHIRHHTVSAKLYFGPGLWKWFTLSWYYYLLFFKTLRKTSY